MTEPGAPHPFLARLIEHWDAVLAELEPLDRARLVELLRGSGPPVQRLAAVRGLLMAGLPPDSDVRRTLLGVGVRLVPTAGGADPASLQRLGELASSVDLAASVDLSASVPTPPPTTPPTPAHEPWHDLHRRVREQLSELPWRRPDQLGPAAEAESEDLITLRYAAADVRLPAFQFDPQDRPLIVVTTVNRLLGAGRDPWAVTCWWVGRHAWLQASPVDLIGRREDDLVAAARAVLAD